MPAEFALPYLEAEALIVVMTRNSALDQAHPLFAMFGRKGQRSAKVKLRYMERKANALRHTSFGGRAVPINRGKIKETLAEPAVLKVFDELSFDDVALFTDAARFQAANEQSALAQATIAEANDRIVQIANDMSTDLEEERHRLMVGACLGEVTYYVYDSSTPRSVSWGLTSITPPSTAWDNVAATIVEDMYKFLSAFRANNQRGLSANAVMYSPKIWEGYFIKNTQWQTYTKLNPDLVKGFMGVQGGQSPFSTLGYVDSLFGLTWIPMEGTYMDVDGVTVRDRWPRNKLVFARLGPDGARPRWQMVLHPLHNPNAEINVEISEPKKGDDVKTYKIVGFENGLPLWEDPQMVQPVEVAAS